MGKKKIVGKSTKLSFLSLFFPFYLVQFFPSPIIWYICQKTVSLSGTYLKFVCPSVPDNWLKIKKRLNLIGWGSKGLLSDWSKIDDALDSLVEDRHVAFLKRSQQA